MEHRIAAINFYGSHTAPLERKVLGSTYSILTAKQCRSAGAEEHTFEKGLKSALIRVIRVNPRFRQ